MLRNIRQNTRDIGNTSQATLRRAVVKLFAPESDIGMVTCPHFLTIPTTYCFAETEN